MRKDRPRVLLLWPGGLFGGGGNFGVPQLLSIAAVLERGGDAEVEVVDLDLERALGPIDPAALAAGRDVIALSCYSSYDYLKCCALAEELARHAPRARLVAGGYHASARPSDFTREGSPFHYVVVGDGEMPLLRLVRALAAGKLPLVRELGPEPLGDVGELPPYDWDKLARYRAGAARAASQAEIYLSRGCPYDCAFCMERAKRDVSWRAFEPERAVEEIHRLDRFLDLSRFTLFIADALFGMKRAWRREFLERLARRPCRARKLWLLIRVDLVEREDLELMARANVAPGFGLESGDPEQLRRIRKSGKLDGYLDRMIHVSEWALELDVPFGANVIVGHPGETERSLRTSAAYLERLFLGGRATTGFLSVDPFRLYPGSPIDEERARWEADTGMRVHRYPWWEDGDQAFLSEWVDPSAELDFRRTLALKRELFDPILRAIPGRFAYGGPARDYFERAIDEQIDLARPERELATLGLWHLWRGLTGEASPGPRSIAADGELAAIAREARAEALRGARFSPAIARALVEVPRERFVAVEQVERSAADEPLPLDDAGEATVSALHAYAAAFDALALAPGDDFVELGGGTGYGAALAQAVVGQAGRVRSLEIDPRLVARAPAEAAELLICGDAHDTARWRGASKVYVAFALEELPAPWIDALADGARLCAPIGPADQQVLTLFEKRAGAVTARALGAVRYVVDRSPSQAREPARVRGGQADRGGAFAE